MRATILTILFALLAATPGANAQDPADDLDALLIQATAAINWEFDREWAYTETSLHDDLLWVARFDPSRPRGERWTLLSVDGRIPDADEIDDFFDEKDVTTWFEEDAEDIFDMIRPGSLALLEETSDHWLLNFAPDEDEENFAANVDGRIKIDKDGPYLESIELKNHETIKAGFGTRLVDFMTRFTYAPAVEGGPLVPRSIEVRVAGRALLFINFDENELVHFSDFKYVGD